VFALGVAKTRPYTIDEKQPSFVWRAFFCAKKKKKNRESVSSSSFHFVVSLCTQKQLQNPRSIRVLQTRYATALLSKRLVGADQTTTMEEDVDDDNDDALFLFFHRVWFATTKKRFWE
jgi:hypothetical protein